MPTNIFTLADLNPRLREDLLDDSRGHTQIANHWNVSDRAVRRWRARHALELNTSAPLVAEEPEAQAVKGSVEVSHNGATVNNVVVEGDLNGDWDKIFTLFNLDGSKFVVVDDTVRMSTWQQSKRLENGERDTIQLYSYSARFRRKTLDDISEETVERWRVSLRETDTGETPITEGSGTYVILPADPQLGKKGTAEAVENWKRGVTEHLSTAQDKIYAGEGLEGIHIAFQGDEIENVANNYTNQPHTVELNLSQQLELAFDMEVWTIREALKLGLPLSVSSVLSNHSEWTRNDSKDPVTTRADNASTYLTRQVAKLFDNEVQWGLPQIGWHIANSDPAVVVTLSGIENYFSHGYIEKGKGGTTEIRTQNAIERQILGRTEELLNVKNYFMAHYHHFYMREDRGRTVFGCPALEAEKSSEYMLDQYGVWSPSGMLGMVVGKDKKRGWSDLAVY